MISVRIIVDAVTDALDAAAPFATLAYPVHLALDGPPDHGKQTISSESRTA